MIAESELKIKRFKFTDKQISKVDGLDELQTLTTRVFNLLHEATIVGISADRKGVLDSESARITSLCKAVKFCMVELAAHLSTFNKRYKDLERWMGDVLSAIDSIMAGGGVDPAYKT